MKPTILLDFDGVIVDSIEIFTRTVRVAAEELNQPVEFLTDDLRSIRRMSIEEISDHVDISRDRIPAFLQAMDRELNRVAYEIPMFPKMANVIRQLHDAGKLGIVSASPASVIEKVLKNHSLDQFFGHVIGGDTPGAKSTKIRSIIQDNNSSVDTTCMIGDTISDIEQGNAADVLTIAVSWGWHSIDWLESANPDFIASEPEDLVELVPQARSSMKMDMN